jgi:membrane protein implicated in regulation of membrane protease activity
VPRIVGEVFFLNLVLALLALISTPTSSTGYRLVLLAIGAAAVLLLLRRFSRQRAS